MLTETDINWNQMQNYNVCRAGPMWRKMFASACWPSTSSTTQSTAGKPVLQNSEHAQNLPVQGKRS